MDTVIYIVGLLTIFSVVTFITYCGFNYKFDNDVVMISFYGFGVIYTAPGSKVCQNLNSLRKTLNKTIFITAPSWFNRKVWNIGGIK